MKNKAAQELGRLGGKVSTEAKAAAVRENGKKGGRPAHEWLVIRDGRTPNKFSIWSKHKTEALAITRCSDLGRNGAEGRTKVIHISERGKWGV